MAGTISLANHYIQPIAKSQKYKKNTMKKNQENSFLPVFPGLELALVLPPLSSSTQLKKRKEKIIKRKKRDLVLN